MARSRRDLRFAAAAALLCALVAVAVLVLQQSASHASELAAEARAAAGRGEVERAFVFWHEAADLGSAEAQHHLGHSHLAGMVVAQDDRLAAIWLRRAAEQGYAEAQQTLGLLCDEGRGVPRDHAEGFRWTRRAAQQGIVSAQYRLGALYESGRGVERSLELAERWYLQAAEQDHTDGQYALGMLHARGVGLIRSPLYAQYWLEPAANKRHVLAQLALGDLLFEEDRHSGTAFDWFRRAAEAGDPDAQYRTARGRAFGYGARLDHVLAARWHHAAAEQGVLESQVALAKQYERGRGIRRNLKEAMVWYAKAAEQGSGAAASARRALVRQVESDERSRDRRWKRELAAHELAARREARLAAERRRLAASQPRVELVGRCESDGAGEMRSKLDCLSRGGQFTPTGGEDHVGVIMGDTRRFWKAKKNTLERQLRRARRNASRPPPAAPDPASNRGSNPASDAGSSLGSTLGFNRSTRSSRDSATSGASTATRAPWLVCYASTSVDQLIGSDQWGGAAGEGQLMCSLPVATEGGRARAQCGERRYTGRQTFASQQEATDWVRRRCWSVD